MPTAKQRYDNTQKKQAISTMEMIIKGLKNGTVEIESQGIWKSLFPEKYSFKVIFKNLREFSEESNDS